MQSPPHSVCPLPQELLEPPELKQPLVPQVSPESQ
jgi:hypothetical protein